MKPIFFKEQALIEEKVDLTFIQDRSKADELMMVDKVRVVLLSLGRRRWRCRRLFLFLDVFRLLPTNGGLNYEGIWVDTVIFLPDLSLLSLFRFMQQS